MEPKTHPAAEMFPMMTDIELRELAADIQKNGLLEPVVLYHGVVLDGRNRLAACKFSRRSAKVSRSQWGAKVPNFVCSFQEPASASPDCKSACDRWCQDDANFAGRG